MIPWTTITERAVGPGDSWEESRDLPGELDPQEKHLLNLFTDMSPHLPLPCGAGDGQDDSAR